MQTKILARSSIVALLLSSVALGATYTITADGNFLSGKIQSLDPKASLFGLSAGRNLAGMPATVVFTIDDSLGQQTTAPPGPAPNQSSISIRTTAPTRLVVAKVSFNGASFEAGGQYPPFHWEPIVSRSVASQGGSLARSSLRVWTSERNVPYTAGEVVALDCASAVGSPFSMDYRWNTSFKYAVPDGAEVRCAAIVSYTRVINKAVVSLEAKFVPSTIAMVGNEPQSPAALNIFFKEGSGWTNISTNKVTVSTGDPIALCAANPAGQCPANAPVGQSQTWEFAGSIPQAGKVASYLPTEPAFRSVKEKPPSSFRDFRDIDYTSHTPTFYWTVPGTGIVRLKYVLPGGGHGVSTAEFTVLAPAPIVPEIKFNGIAGAPFMQQDVDNPEFMDKYGKEFIFGGGAGEDSGPFFRVVNSNASPTGSYHWRQLVYSRSTEDKKPCTNNWGLDTGYWYVSHENDPTRVVDVARTRMPKVATRVERLFKAEMWLMWQSAHEGSIPVPIGYVPWGYHAVFTRPAVGGVWVVAKSEPSFPKDFLPPKDLPEWKQVNSSNTCEEDRPKPK